MEREEENRRPGAGRPPSAADTPMGVGCRAWRTTRGCLFSFGNERAAALGVPRGGWPPGEGIDANRNTARALRVHRCATWHTSREDRHPAGTRRRHGGSVGARQRADRAVPGRVARPIVSRLARASHDQQRQTGDHMPLILKRSVLVVLLCVAGLGAAGMALWAINLVIRMFARLHIGSRHRSDQEMRTSDRLTVLACTTVTARA